MPLGFGGDSNVQVGELVGVCCLRCSTRKELRRGIDIDWLAGIRSDEYLIVAEYGVQTKSSDVEVSTAIDRARKLTEGQGWVDGELEKLHYVCSLHDEDNKEQEQ